MRGPWPCPFKMCMVRAKSTGAKPNAAAAGCSPIMPDMRATAVGGPNPLKGKLHPK